MRLSDKTKIHRSFIKYVSISNWTYMYLIINIVVHITVYDNHSLLFTTYTIKLILN